MRIDIREKRFGDKIIFKNFSLSVSDGERVLITGESGRGKTTLLRLIAGLDGEYDGSIDFPSPVMLFQEERLIENMSVLSNLMLVTAGREKAAMLLEKAGLAGEEKSIISSLSGGMKRRVSIVRLLLLESSVYLLDEPFTGLDEETKRKTAALITEKTEGKTVIVVSHTEGDGMLLGCTREIAL